MTIKKEFFILIFGWMILFTLAVLILIEINKDYFASPKEILALSLIFYIGITTISIIYFFKLGLLLVLAIATSLICLLFGNFLMSMKFHINVSDTFAFLDIYKEHFNNFIMVEKLLYFGAYLCPLAIVLPLSAHLIKHLSKTNK